MCEALPRGEEPTPSPPSGSEARGAKQGVRSKGCEARGAKQGEKETRYSPSFFHLIQQLLEEWHNISSKTGSQSFKGTLILFIGTFI